MCVCVYVCVYTHMDLCKVNSQGTRMLILDTITNAKTHVRTSNQLGLWWRFLWHIISQWVNGIMSQRSFSNITYVFFVFFDFEFFLILFPFFWQSPYFFLQCNATKRERFAFRRIEEMKFSFTLQQIHL